MRALLTLSLVLLTGCGIFGGKGTDPDPREESDTDTDTDADTDVDADTDTDTDTGTDVDDRTVSGVALCGGSGRASDGAYVATACVGPVDAGAVTATDGTYTLQAGPVRRIAP